LRPMAAHEPAPMGRRRSAPPTQTERWARAAPNGSARSVARQTEADGNWKSSLRACAHLTELSFVAARASSGPAARSGYAQHLKNLCVSQTRLALRHIGVVWRSRMAWAIVPSCGVVRVSLTHFLGVSAPHANDGGGPHRTSGILKVDFGGGV